jgi:hypothetical protein
MPRKAHTFNFIYKTTCLITGRYYIGLHSTSNLDDAYLGSGTRLWKSIKKYGKKNHKREILEFLPDRKALAAREREIVDESIINDPMCMNLMKGGEAGGFINDSHQIKCASAGGQRTASLIKEDLDYAEAHSLKMSIANKRAYLNGKIAKTPDWSGRSHSAEAKQKIATANSIQQSGEKNSQFGTRWMHLPGGKPVKVKLAELDHYAKEGYLLGRVSSNK